MAAKIIIQIYDNLINKCALFQQKIGNIQSNIIADKYFHIAIQNFPLLFNHLYFSVFILVSLDIIFLSFNLFDQQMQVRRLNRSKAVLMLCDIQQKFTPHVYAHQAVQQAIVLCLKITNCFDLPVIATEHNPKAFGKILPEIVKHLPNNHHFSQKITFSMVDEKVEQTLKKHSNRDQIILVGMQTHACILQTFIDLKLRNYQVFLPLDAISSRRVSDRTYAIQRLIAQGGIPTSVESLAFELLGNYKDENFKKVSTLLKEGGLRTNAIPHL